VFTEKLETIENMQAIEVQNNSTLWRPLVSARNPQKCALKTIPKKYVDLLVIF
jgi:hypothetical protein